MATTAIEGWITVREAAALTDYTTAHIRYLTRKGRVEARKTGRDWLILRSSLLAYKARMDTLGTQKHNPYREDLDAEGRGGERYDEG
jgi:excisionase family DNA binding protein